LRGLGIWQKWSTRTSSLEILQNTFKLKVLYSKLYGLWWSDREVCQFCTNWSINRCFTTHFNHSLLLTFSVSHIYVNPHSFRIVKALNYRIFKTKFEFEEYFNILNIGDVIRLCRFRTTNHYLPIETGRWRNIDEIFLEFEFGFKNPII
jgi:hypothetical protein